MTYGEMRRVEERGRERWRGRESRNGASGEDDRVEKESGGGKSGEESEWE